MTDKKMTDKKKPIPKFASEDEEREFWSREDTTDYVDWGRARRTGFSNLEPTFRQISVTLSERLLEEIELLAEQRGVPIDVLIEKYLAEKILEKREAEGSC